MLLGKFTLLIAIGIAAGLISSIAGLASLVSYPALLALGLSPIAANVTNTVALTLNGAGSIAGSRPELQGQRARAIRIAIAAGIGGALGGVLLLVTPASAFEKLVPWLIGGASLFILVPRRKATLPASDEMHSIWVTLGIGAIGIYGGYFGAASGVMSLALLLLVAGDPFPRAVALKNVSSGAANTIAAIVFAFVAPVDWLVALPLAIGFFAGGRVGPTVVRRLPQRPLRIAIALAGIVVAIRLGYRTYR